MLLISADHFKALFFSSWWRNKVAALLVIHSRFKFKWCYTIYSHRKGSFLFWWSVSYAWLPWPTILSLSTSSLDLWFHNSKPDLVVLSWYLHAFLFLEIVFTLWNFFLLIFVYNPDTKESFCSPQTNAP